MRDFSAQVTREHEAFSGFLWDVSWRAFGHHLKNIITLKLLYGETMWEDLKREKLKKPRSPGSAGRVKEARPWRGSQPHLSPRSQHHARPGEVTWVSPRQPHRHKQNDTSVVMSLYLGWFVTQQYITRTWALCMRKSQNC